MTSGSKQDSPVFPRSAGGKWRLLASDTMWGKLRGHDDGKPYTPVLFSVIVTPMYSHRVHSLQALERLSQPSSHDDGKPGDDDGKQYTRCSVFRHRDPSVLSSRPQTPRP